MVVVVDSVKVEDGLWFLRASPVTVRERKTDSKQREPERERAKESEGLTKKWPRFVRKSGPGSGWN